MQAQLIDLTGRTRQRHGGSKPSATLLRVIATKIDGLPHLRQGIFYRSPRLGDHYTHQRWHLRFE